jgi:hypothetical protein
MIGLAAIGGGLLVNWLSKPSAEERAALQIPKIPDSHKFLQPGRGQVISKEGEGVDGNATSRAGDSATVKLAAGVSAQRVDAPVPPAPVSAVVLPAQAAPSGLTYDEALALVARGQKLPVATSQEYQTHDVSVSPKLLPVPGVSRQVGGMAGPQG